MKQGQGFKKTPPRILRNTPQNTSPYQKRSSNCVFPSRSGLITCTYPTRRGPSSMLLPTRKGLTTCTPPYHKRLLPTFLPTTRDPHPHPFPTRRGPLPMLLFTRKGSTTCSPRSLPEEASHLYFMLLPNRGGPANYASLYQKRG